MSAIEIEAAFDGVQPFRIDGAPIRGRFVRLDKTLARVLANHNYPEAVARLLAECLALAAMLANSIKYDGVFILEIRGTGPIRLIVVDVRSDGDMRGYAQYDADSVATVVLAAAGELASVPRLLGAGQLAFTVDQGPDTERYQGVVELDGATLADCAHHYFRRSEQIETGVKLAVETGEDVTDAPCWRVGGMMIQRMPDAARGVSDEAGIDDAWRRTVVLMSSATPDELLDPALAPSALLYRLFHEDGVWVYESKPLRFGCRCSRDRVAALLHAMQRDEIMALKQDDRVIVTCEFCGTAESFDDADLEALYAA